MVACACHPSYTGGINSRIEVQTSPGIKGDPISNITKGAGCWWLTPIILPTGEAEIRRIDVQSHPRQIVHETLS
jgi:hypothetical protein